MSRIVLIILLLGVVACGSEDQESTQVDAVVREQELAKNSVWHKARLRGVAFRAIGQEPGWLLEIINDEEILLVTEYGKTRNAYPYVEPQEDKTARKTIYQIRDDTNILIESKPCSDSMSGESFEVTVTVMLGDKKLQGCGRALNAGASGMPDKSMTAAGATICEEPRSGACTRDYRPVCATFQDGGDKTYSNGCTACTDVGVTAWVEGPCLE
jgi:uncharacterized membrane protein